MIEEIKKNIESEIQIVREISFYNYRLDFSGPSEKALINSTIDSLLESLRIINDSIPSLVDEISFTKKLPGKIKEDKKRLEKISYQRGEAEFNITIKTSDKKRLLKELSISESYIRKLKKKRKSKVIEYQGFKATRGYLKLANKLFLHRAIRATKKGHYKRLSKELRKANIDVLFQSYLAMVYTTVFIAFFISFILLVFLFFFEINLSLPIISFYEGNYLIRFLKIFWIPIVLPFIVFLSLYFYPSTEKQALSRRINQELPFAVIHMNAISGSGIEPTEIFRIIGLSREYPYLRKEIRKVLNQINLYGYDLVTALNNTAMSTSSNKLAELFSGLATTITSGGSFSDFFNKRAETLLLDYRLERQKYTKTAETFMDIYISVVIAAPMILMLFLILLTIGNFNIGLSTGQLTLLIILVTATINIFFLIFLHLNQPTY